MDKKKSINRQLTGNLDGWVKFELLKSTNIILKYYSSWIDDKTNKFNNNLMFKKKIY